MIDRSRIAGEASSLVAGSLVNGLAAYAFIVVGTRALGADAFAPVAVLWSFWAASAAVLTFPIQHWAIRRIEIDGDTGSVRASLRPVAAWAAALTAVQTVVAAMWAEDLFGEGGWFWPAAVAALALGSAVLGLARGVLAGRGRYHAAATLIGSENVLRLLAGSAAVALSDDPRILAAALLVGPLAVLGWPSTARLDRSSTPGDLGLIGSTGAGILVSQILLNGGPPVLAAAGGAEAQVTALFTTLALFRAPYLVALGLSVRATAPITRAVAGGRAGEVRRSTLAGVAAGVLLAAAALPIGWWLAPPLVEVLFGPGSRPAPGAAAAVAAGAVMALVALGVTVVLIAVGSQVRVIVTWLVGLAAAAVTLLLGSAGQEGVAAAFAAGEAAAVAAGTALAVSALRPRRA